ncbi:MULTISPECIES: hypothetical protein [unclassified Mesorhizobium]|uniref:hypothetical protein n=1 Tax=unclassified Mesorhizobium TaxID=325217 RepID=UPI0033398E1F
MNEAEGSATNKETARRIVQAKGWDVSLVEPIRQCVNSAKVWRKRKAKGIGGRQGREELVEAAAGSGSFTLESPYLRVHTKM